MPSDSNAKTQGRSAPRLAAGASGYSFKEWKGTFYPENIKPEAMLAWYAERLPHGRDQQHVLPDAEDLGARELGGDDARGLSGSRSRRRAASRTSRGSRRNRAAEPLGFLYRNLAALGAKRGPVLFQLPPQPEEGPAAARRRSCSLLPADHRAAFEFRNDTWFADDVYDALQGRRRGAVPVRARGQRAAAAGRDRAVGLRAAAPRELLGRRTAAVGRSGSRRRRGARSTCTSCTSRRRRRTRGR